MNTKEVLKELESLTDAKTKALNTKYGVSEKQYGVKLGDLRVVAKKIKTNHALALELWDTENYDARMLALLIIEPKKLSADELDSGPDINWVPTMPMNIIMIGPTPSRLG